MPYPRVIACSYIFCNEMIIVIISSWSMVVMFILFLFVEEEGKSIRVSVLPFSLTGTKSYDYSSIDTEDKDCYSC